jgi:hypothetical protein
MKEVSMEEELELPYGFVFEDLQLRRDPASKGFSVMNAALLDEVLAYNGIDPERLRKQPFHLWVCLHATASCYRVHIARGGKPNELMEQLNAGTLHL